MLTAPSPDSCGGPAYSHITAVRSLLQPTSFLGFFPGENIDGVWTWQFLLNGLTITLTSEKQPDESYLWLLIWNGTDTTNQRTYSNWKYLEGTSGSDGTSGDLAIYDSSNPSSQTPFMDISWQTLTSGAVEATIDRYSGGNPDSRIILVTYPNGSGEITEFTWNGSTWVPTGYHAIWSGEGAAAICS